MNRIVSDFILEDEPRVIHKVFTAENKVVAGYKQDLFATQLKRKGYKFTIKTITTE